MQVAIGNKNYSSWSMRAWVVLTHLQVLKNSIQTIQARRSQQGFTLIEIAIVLVIIRLLVGGVM